MNEVLHRTLRKIVCEYENSREDAAEVAMVEIAREAIATPPPPSLHREPIEADREAMAYAIIKGSGGERAADHAKEFVTANWNDALRSADAVIATLPAAVETGWVVGNGSDTAWRAWEHGNPVWVDDRAKATRYARREDAEAVHAEDENAWTITPYVAPQTSVTELDANNEAMVCTGCGTTKTVAFIKANSPTAFTCCPERKMVPARAALASKADDVTEMCVSRIERLKLGLPTHGLKAEALTEAANAIRAHRLAFSTPAASDAEAMREACAKVAEEAYSDSRWAAPYQIAAQDIANRLRALPLPKAGEGEASRAAVAELVEALTEIDAWLKTGDGDGAAIQARVQSLLSRHQENSNG